MVQTEVRVLSMYRFASSLSDIHLHTSIMTCFGFSSSPGRVYFLGVLGIGMHYLDYLWETEIYSILVMREGSLEIQ